MGVEVTAEGLARFFDRVLPHMNELQRRVVGGAASELLGRGHKTAVAVASGMSRTPARRSPTSRVPSPGTATLVASHPHGACRRDRCGSRRRGSSRRANRSCGPDGRHRLGPRDEPSSSQELPDRGGPSTSQAGPAPRSRRACRRRRSRPDDQPSAILNSPEVPPWLTTTTTSNTVIVPAQDAFSVDTRTRSAGSHRSIEAK